MNLMKFMLQPTKENSVGTLNNFLVVKDSDFEVFEALALDSNHKDNIKGKKQFVFIVAFYFFLYYFAYSE